MKQTLRNNGLSIVLFILFALSLTGQIVMGFKEYNDDLSNIINRRFNSR